jgi:hypothetical protein
MSGLPKTFRTENISLGIFMSSYYSRNESSICAYNYVMGKTFIFHLVRVPLSGILNKPENSSSKRKPIYKTITEMMNAVFWDIKTQYVLHRGHITSPLHSPAS